MCAERWRILGEWRDGDERELEEFTGPETAAWARADELAADFDDWVVVWAEPITTRVNLEAMGLL